MSPEEIGRLWEGIGKQGLLQYKLKVDMTPEVNEIIDRD